MIFKKILKQKNSRVNTAIIVIEKMGAAFVLKSMGN